MLGLELKALDVPQGIVKQGAARGILQVQGGRRNQQSSLSNALLEHQCLPANMPRRTNDLHDRIKHDVNCAVKENAFRATKNRVKEPITPAFVWMAGKNRVLSKDGPAV